MSNESKLGCMEDDQDVWINRLHEQSLRELDLISPAMSEIRRYSISLKLRVAYFDKLIVLDAGTLALSFSAVFTFASHTTSDLNRVPINHLFDAWKLLIFSIVAALISNWLHMNFCVNTHVLVNDTILRGRDFLRSVALKRIVPATDPNAHLPSEADKISKANKLRRYRKIENAALALGILSQIAPFFAYIFLYQFAKGSFSKP